MIFELNVRYSVRCSECGKKLDCAADTNSAENYDVVLVVEPHDCSRTTPRALDGGGTCACNPDLFNVNAAGECLWCRRPRQ